MKDKNGIEIKCENCTYAMVNRSTGLLERCELNVKFESGACFIDNFSPTKTALEARILELEAECDQPQICHICGKKIVPTGTIGEDICDCVNMQFERDKFKAFVEKVANDDKETERWIQTGELIDEARALLRRESEAGK